MDIDLKALLGFVIVGIIVTLVAAGIVSFMFPIKTGKDRPRG